MCGACWSSGVEWVYVAWRVHLEMIETVVIYLFVLLHSELNHTGREMVIPLS